MQLKFNTMKKILTIAIIGITPMLTCVCQPNKSIAKFEYDGSIFTPSANKFIAKNSELSVYVGSYLTNKFSHITDTLCNKGFALVRFKVSKKKGLVEIACSKSTPIVLSKLFKDAVESSSNYWHVRNDSDLYYILPINYEFLTNCKVVHNDMESLRNNIFEFDDDTTVEDVKCIFLQPLTYSTGVGDN